VAPTKQVKIYLSTETEKIVYLKKKATLLAHVTTFLIDVEKEHRWRGVSPADAKLVHDLRLGGLIAPPAYHPHGHRRT
jgi:hypothetical protein